jgi:murein DD-endopeptidase MepM/ murein hydrolase activator NlpD
MAFLVAGAVLCGMPGLLGQAFSPYRGSFASFRLKVHSRLRTIEADLAAARGEAFHFRQRLGLPPLPAESRRLGTGGASPPEFTDPLEADLRRIALECELVRASLRQVGSRLQARRDLWRHIPMSCPVPSGYVSSRFGNRPDPFDSVSTFHAGLDIRAPSGSPVYATADGVVSQAACQAGHGLMAAVDHGNGFITRYAHAGALLVREGEAVRRGQLIARVGSSGRVTAPHLHYEVRRSGLALNPERFLAIRIGEPD